MSQSTPLRTDVVVIGAGPVGLSAVFQCGMLKLRCHVVDALEAPGGQLTALYPEKPIYDVPGFPSIPAGELIDRLLEQVAPFTPEFHLSQQVIALEAVAGAEPAAWRLTTSRGVVLEAAAVIIAAGAGAFGPNRPPLDRLEAFEGTSVFYMVSKREAFRGRKVVIAGGGDSAVDWAISLSDVAERVHVVHRRPKFRCAPESAARLDQLAAEGKIDLVIPYQLKALGGTEGRLESVTVADLDGAERQLDADVLLPFFGLAANLGPIAEWGLGVERQTIPVTQATCRTARPGIYAVGDVASYPGKLKLILTGFAEASAAAHNAFHDCRPGEALHFEHSTTTGVPGIPA
ncbi:NAD(P)/FAD-dependent oxidoreductase [Rhodospirillum rubrum]|uniref:Ferredoxin--NADP reductase n=1 Tax=Rhodospirillum rubrum (strain ATCC 11170 / ATH 1.1.1 / DSM 467 / LMG 4362 / NCIMB 8255 / S1) TaxID=269796 RepID=FENR_RHORT|nr:NAD(P)/FAD-dependent oxidoreductase [Rhodospirillum rubrum]Q2RNR2.1 RecName: Full=Ferredoxin--NADP reductase; Short=FNR; Short=Fd-NADP(+) reductase [Rhodospirillum rubrum ATCC 11170]ABC24233.1 FAD-dependent pyridine nucleotide-disulphide oxidoreductase [Rhodospirillum rubrum ATCC 11170]AEO49984.1 thioredoxin reductase [Rhodospirillum rubrum F11]MBK5955952.1 ferredoxin--NADP(+) reductase [Rhodospirillum rubrum]QXG80168.1 NAD(P)/FAD-dependent oxidoreductase [Rhodospirillum rubrum]